MKLKDYKLCDCGCGHVVFEDSLKENGKVYASSYCLLKESKVCSYCGERYKDCKCNFKALD